MQQSPLTADIPIRVVKNNSQDPPASDGDSTREKEVQTKWPSPAYACKMDIYVQRGGVSPLSWTRTSAVAAIPLTRITEIHQCLETFSGPRATESFNNRPSVHQPSFKRARSTRVAIHLLTRRVEQGSLLKLKLSYLLEVNGYEDRSIRGGIGAHVHVYWALEVPLCRRSLSIYRKKKDTHHLR